MLSSLLFIAFLLTVSVHSQNTTTTTTAPTTTDIWEKYDCHCETYVQNNFTKSDGSGCISGDAICPACPGDKKVCICEKSAECETINDVIKGLATFVIVIIAIGALCCCCCIGGGLYFCFCN